MQIIAFCCEQFNFVLPSRQIANRRDACKFIKSDSQRTNLLTFVTMQVLPLCSYVLFYHQFRQVHAVCFVFFFIFLILVKLLLLCILLYGVTDICGE